MKHLFLFLLALILVLTACTNEGPIADNNGKPDVPLDRAEPTTDQPNVDAPKKPEVIEYTEGDDFGALLVGTWQSTDDPNSMVTFTETERTDSYKGTNSATVSPYEMAYNCEGDAPPSADGKAPSYLRTIEGNDDDQCWYVVSVTADRLELSYVGRGNSLVYERVAN